MQWILHDFEDTRLLGEALARLGLQHSWHRLVPFVGELIPEPVIANPADVVLFGAYTLRHYAERHGLRPGVFVLSPFAEQAVWQPHLLNGPGARFMTLREVPERLRDDGRAWFLRPVDDSKAEPGRVRTAGEIVDLASRVLALREDEIPLGSLRPDTRLMLSEPVRIGREWRFWVVGGRIVAHSLYRDGSRVIYRADIDADALAFAQAMAELNPDYAPAYVLDIGRTDSGLRLIETNCVNAAGFYAADVERIALAIEGLAQG